MATWANTRTEVARLHQFPGIVAVPRKTGASTYELWLKDSRQLAQNQTAAAVSTYQPGGWLSTTVSAAGIVIN